MRSSGEINSENGTCLNVSGKKGLGYPKKTYDECVNTDLKGLGLSTEIERGGSILLGTITLCAPHQVEAHLRAQLS